MGQQAFARQTRENAEGLEVLSEAIARQGQRLERIEDLTRRGFNAVGARLDQYPGHSEARLYALDASAVLRRGFFGRLKWLVTGR